MRDEAREHAVDVEVETRRAAVPGELVQFFFRARGSEVAPAIEHDELFGFALAPRNRAAEGPALEPHARERPPEPYRMCEGSFLARACSTARAGAVRGTRA